ncbi:2-dehydropantoate 2-reductase [Nakamurella sp. UYEF19]|uniref:ketopantoate reductase family protein n=1 Tax=Nakamurella sp. UYEF19 TaxID=1756392 RepID=UPI00339534EE
MRYIVIGAGAVGGSIGAALFQGGHSVILVARGAHGQAMASDGLEFATPRGTSTLDLPVVSGPDEVKLEPDDVLVLGVKVQQSIEALDLWSAQPVAGGGTAGELLPIFCAQNGAEGERLALRRFARVYGICVMLPAGHLAPGRIAAYGDPLIGVLTIGAYPSGTDDLTSRVCADLERCLIGGHPSAGVMRWKYTKLLANLGNALEAIGGPIEGDAALALLMRARSEGEKVLLGAGIDFADPQEDAGVRVRLATADIPGHPRGGGSTWQSMTRGTGNIEADYLSGEIVLLGRLHGIPTPVNQTLRRVANDLARQGLPPGTVGFDELTSLVDAAARS